MPRHTCLGDVKERDPVSVREAESKSVTVNTWRATFPTYNGQLLLRRPAASSFLFALSASPEDAATNTDLLTTCKCMDLFVIYSTGKRAIPTLEKNEEAMALFTEVFEAWREAPTE